MKKVSKVKYPQWFLPFPEFIAFEVSGACQSRCAHCPHGQGLIKKQGIMKIDLFKKLISEIKSLLIQYPAFHPDIVLYGNGEPLLNKNIVEMIRISSSLGCKTVMSSNIGLIKPEHGRLFNEAGLHLIKLSFWGDKKKEYEKRCQFKFNESIEKAVNFIRESSPEMEIVINIVKSRQNHDLTIDNDFKKNFMPERFKNVSFYSFYASDWRGTIKNEVTQVNVRGEPDRVPCRLASELMPITWDGKIAFCWLDYNREIILEENAVGNILKAWRHPKRIAMLRLMVDQQYKKNHICRDCSALYTEGRKKRILEKGGKGTVIYDHLYKRTPYKHTSD